MVVSCVARTYAEAQKIRKMLVAITGSLPANVFEEKLAADAFVVSVRIESDLQVHQAIQALEEVGVKEISQFTEAA